MEFSTISGFDKPVILTAGVHCRLCDGRFGQIVGVFSGEDDALSSDSDDRVLAVISMDDLPEKDRDVAERNSDFICDYVNGVCDITN